MPSAKATSAEDQINKSVGKLGFEQLQTYNASTSMLQTTSDYKHKQYEFQKSLRIKEQRRKERIRKEVEKACNPDQLVKFVTQFRVPTIQDSVTEVARRQAESVEASS